ncbi:MAG TPA: hypothetical protein PLJ84_07540 [Bacteroidales bacterium]|nr:hypothetical protein [Bacteroidales bacterium]HPT02437.1 hypothetical protein [Bacteroidales bacterium]
MPLFVRFNSAILLLACFSVFSVDAQPAKEHNLRFDNLPARWDEAIPLGNGMIGALVWQKDGKLRISIDRADLWDLRPTKEIEKYTYRWAYEHRLTGDWDTVWKVADEPYDRDPGPTKLPGASVEFDISALGKVKSIELNIASAICSIYWINGASFRIFVDAMNPVVRYSWEGTGPEPVLVPPAYGNSDAKSGKNPVVEGYSLSRLGYEQGTIRKLKNITVYTQQAWRPLKYQAAVASNQNQGAISITSHYSDRPKAEKASFLVKKAVKSTFDEAAAAHKQWWRDYWSRSSIQIPDKQLEKQWYLEIYKFGASSRKGAPPVSLQAIWTADNGLLPPWKGDFHSDLNTQLSYWPAYSSNHLDEGAVFTDWLWNNKSYFEQYTKRVFDTDGINVPGVATLRGHEMGGWHMYAMSPTVSCWLAQHFYLQWRYSMDRSFLTERAYPWISAAARHIEQITEQKDGIRTLPMSSSPEFHDGGMTAWFLVMTNYDLALTKYIFRIASELATEVGNAQESEHWKEIGKQLPDFDVDPSEGLTVAPGFPMHESHRHFSHLMAFHPLGLLNYEDENDRQIIQNSLDNLEKFGTGAWCGYSFSWLGNIYARMKLGEKAASALREFAACYCSQNSFHLNNSRCKSGFKSEFNGPFTLEGNFAFAAGIQEMLLQSYNGCIEVFPAIPSGWKDVSFQNLRAEGAFLVSANKENGIPVNFQVESKKGGRTFIKLPFPTYVVKYSQGAKITVNKNHLMEVAFEKGGKIDIENGYE